MTVRVLIRGWNQWYFGLLESLNAFKSFILHIVNFYLHLSRLVAWASLDPITSSVVCTKASSRLSLTPLPLALERFLQL